MIKVRSYKKTSVKVGSSRPCKADPGLSRILQGLKQDRVVDSPSGHADMRVKQQDSENSSHGNAFSSVFDESITEEIKRDIESTSTKTHSIDLKTSHRTLVEKKIKDALTKKCDLRMESSLDFEKIAARVETALHEAFANSTKEYTTKARSVIHNLNDANNIDFRNMLAMGFIRPTEVPHLAPEQMASYEKLNERSRLKKESMEEARSDWELAQGTLQSTSLLTCEGCYGCNMTYFQLQTRKCDEPVTTYVMCLDCRLRWKF